jgi:hypothetical protein
MKKTMEKVDVKYEIPMYKLVGIFGICFLVFMGIGFWMGNTIGYAKGVDNAEVIVPDYCSASYRGDKITITCTEMEDYTASELCSMLSSSLKDKIKVVVITN